MFDVMAIHCRIFQLPVWTSAHYQAVFLPSAGPHCWSFLHTTAWLILQQSRVTWPHEYATPAKQTQELLLATENTPSKHKRPLYTVETEHASLALWTGNKQCFPVVCDYMVKGPHWFQLGNQTKQLLKANMWEIHYRKIIISFPLACHLACLAKHDAISRDFLHALSHLDFLWATAMGQRGCVMWEKTWRCLTRVQDLSCFCT